MSEKISISKYREQGAKIFTDRDRGLKARNELGLDQIEEKKQEVPDTIKFL